MEHSVRGESLGSRLVKKQGAALGPGVNNSSADNDTDVEAYITGVLFGSDGGGSGVGGGSRAEWDAQRETMLDAKIKPATPWSSKGNLLGKDGRERTCLTRVNQKKTPMWRRIEARNHTRVTAKAQSIAPRVVNAKPEEDGEDVGGAYQTVPDSRYPDLLGEKGEIEDCKDLHYETRKKKRLGNGDAPRCSLPSMKKYDLARAGSCPPTTKTTILTGGEGENNSRKSSVAFPRTVSSVRFAGLPTAGGGDVSGPPPAAQVSTLSLSEIRGRRKSVQPKSKLKVTPRTIETLRSQPAPKTLKEVLGALSDVIASNHRHLWSVAFPSRNKTARELTLERKAATITFLKACYKANPDEPSISLNFLKTLRKGFTAMSLGEDRLSSELLCFHLGKNNLSSQNLALTKKGRPMSFFDCLGKMFPGVHYDATFGEPEAGSDDAFLLGHEGVDFLNTTESIFNAFCTQIHDGKSHFYQGKSNFSNISNGGGSEVSGSSTPFVSAKRHNKTKPKVGQVAKSLDPIVDESTPFPDMLAHRALGRYVTREGLARMVPNDVAVFPKPGLVVEQVLEDFDADNDGMLDFTEFMYLMMDCFRPNQLVS